MDRRWFFEADAASLMLAQALVLVLNGVFVFRHAASCHEMLHHETPIVSHAMHGTNIISAQNDILSCQCHARNVLPGDAIKG